MTSVVVTREDSPLRYNKLLVQVIAVVVAFVTSIQMQGAEWGLPLGTAISGVAAALAVWWTENTVAVPLGKFYAAITTSFGVALSAVIAQSEWRTALATFIVSVLGAFAVLITPNAQPATPLTVDPKVVEPPR
jgi:hypothetical protein